jgi:hypothetical protein
MMEGEQIVLETNEQCEYYAGLSALLDGNIVQAQRLEPGVLEIEENA